MAAAPNNNDSSQTLEGRAKVGDLAVALRMAAYYGRVECVKILIPFSDPKDENSCALYLAARHGHAECVGLLIPVPAPKNENSWALRHAAENGHAQRMRALGGEARMAQTLWALGLALDILAEAEALRKSCASPLRPPRPPPRL